MAFSLTLRLSWFLALISLSRGDPASDMMDKFKSNIADAVADALLSEFKLGASGRIENYSNYDLRLIRCDNERGGMVQPFPSKIMPDESKLFSGFGVADPSLWGKKENKDISICTGTAGKLHQRCDYGVFSQYDPKTKKSQLQALITLEFKVSKSEPKIRVNVCANSNKKECDGKDKDSKDTSSSSSDDLDPVRFCSHPNENICVEALISNGDKANLYFHIYPRLHKNLSPKMFKMFETAYEWCNFLMTAMFFTKQDAKGKRQEFEDCVAKGGSKLVHDAVAWREKQKEMEKAGKGKKPLLVE